MKIEIERSGGFPGMIKTITVDTDKLPKDVANIIEKSLSETRLSNRSSNTMKSKVVDCYYYKISTQIGKNKHEIRFREFDVDEEVRSIMNFLFKKY